MAMCVQAGIAESAATDRLPDARLARSAYGAIERAVRDWTMPADVDVELPGVEGACVTLRLGGVVIGRGVAVRSLRGAGDEAGCDLLAAATRDAMGEAEPRLHLDHDALERDALIEAARRIMIDVELAGTLIPIDDITDLSDILRWTATADRGLACRLDDRQAAIFPGAMRASNLLDIATLRAMMGELGVLPESLPELIGQDRITIYRFDVLQRAQPSPGAPSLLMHRGGAVVELGDVRMTAVRDAAESLAAHLEARLWPRPEPFGLLGTYLPWRDDSSPRFASPAQDALAAYALLRFSQASGISDPAARSAEQTAVAILERITRRHPSEDDPLRTPAGAAMIVIAALELPPSLRSETVESLTASAIRFLDAVMTDELSRELIDQGPGAQRAVIAFAATRLAAERTTDLDPRELVDALWRDTDAGALPNVMPWLGWAELTLCAEQDAVPAAGALRSMRKVVWDHQIQPVDVELRDRDLLGGIVFSRSRHPLPSWHSARPLALIATMLSDDRLTGDAEIVDQVVRMSRSIRFLIQLTMRDSELYMAKNTRRARGGVRAAVWDNRMPIDASSMTLLTFTEMIVSTDALSRRVSPAAR
ncbi:MAG: hypothetical protein KAS72_00975 [Phycisphaerales bacterium]|nr:hypothetical protein [Phycisphaerales bacterium]